MFKEKNQKHFRYAEQNTAKESFHGLGQEPLHLAVSIVEVSLFLVVFGIMCGCVLQGNALHKQHQARILMDNLTQVQGAWVAFKETYQALPGDLHSTRAAWWSSEVASGNGNGQLDNPEEYHAVFLHLYLAGYLTQETYVKMHNTEMRNHGQSRCTSVVCIDNGFGGQFSIVSEASGYAVDLGVGVPESVLAALDKRFDDGQTTQGSITGWQSSAHNNFECNRPNQCNARAFLPHLTAKFVSSL